MTGMTSMIGVDGRAGAGAESGVAIAATRAGAGAESGVAIAATRAEGGAGAIAATRAEGGAGAGAESGGSAARVGPAESRTAGPSPTHFAREIASTSRHSSGSARTQSGKACCWARAPTGEACA